MSMCQMIVVALACVTSAGCSNFDRSREGKSPAGAPEHQILIMLKESPVRHFQPGVSYSPMYRSDAAQSPQLRTAKDLAREYRLHLVSDWPMPAIGVRCFLAEVEADQTPVEVAARLAADPRVESAQPVQMFRTLAHNDPYYGLQTNATAIRLDELHKLSTGKNVLVAEIDTGVDLRHPDLQGQLTEAKNFVDGIEYTPEMHGTSVAGIIVAKADNGIGIVGIAPGARLMPLRACWQQAQDVGSALCSSFTLAKALQYALAQHAQILNLSLAGPHDRLLERLIDKAIEQGSTVISALDPAAPDASFPATHPRVIAVASTGTSTAFAGVIFAPGDRILSTTPNASWGFVTGSSFATAHVTGIAALLLELSPSLKSKDVYALLREHSYPAAPSGEPPVLDACAMLARLSEHRGCACCGVDADPRARRQVGPNPS
jgi:subtilisin family serine protease